ncbi:MAG: UbiA family prenyltransferase [Cytophagales bacterium]|nr:UbiA family prenyltransferase [Cytophagales bacterium]
MFSRSTLLHLRIPFSYFLLPVFLFAVAISPNLIQDRLLWVLIILHVFLYPASNGYNSYFDKDEKSIGGLKNPPPVSGGLYWISLILDAVAVVMGAIKLSFLFSAMVLLYGLVSKAYSHPIVRLKKYPVAGWLVTGVFQGFFTFMMCYVGINNFYVGSMFQTEALVPAILTSFMLWANYPMTQVYQHEEDARHGDMTMSRMLGIRGTFVFSGLFFGITTLGFIWYFVHFYHFRQAGAFLLALSPVVLYFGYWFWRVMQDGRNADHTHAMRLNLISATCLNAFFVWLLFDTGNLGQYLF